MKHKIILNQQDIKNIISEKFDVPVKDVDLLVKKESVGYGIAEHNEKVIYCEIVKNGGSIV